MKLTLWLGASATGMVSPPTAKSLRVDVARKIISLLPLELVKLTACDWLPPIATFPKLRFEVLGVSWPGVDPPPPPPPLPGAVPVPERATDIVGCDAEVEITIVSLEGSAACGVKLTTNWSRCLGPIVTGKAGWVI